MITYVLCGNRKFSVILLALLLKELVISVAKVRHTQRSAPYSQPAKG